MKRYFATFHKRGPQGAETEEYGQGRTMPDGLRDAWGKLPKVEQRGVTRAKVTDLETGKIVQYDLRQGAWVRVGPVEPNRAIKPLEEDEGL